jgi:hypothetical protein
MLYSGNIWTHTKEPIMDQARWGNVKNFLPTEVKPVLKHIRLSCDDDAWVKRRAQELDASYAEIIRGCIRMAREGERHGA